MVVRITSENAHNSLFAFTALLALLGMTGCTQIFAPPQAEAPLLPPDAVACEEEECFQTNLEQCVPSFFLQQGEGVVLEHRIAGEKEGACDYYMEVKSVAGDSALQGQSLRCSLPAPFGQYRQRVLEQSDAIKEYCIGSLVSLSGDVCTFLGITQGQVAGDSCNAIRNQNPGTINQPLLPFFKPACDQMEGNQRDNCYQQEAVNNKDASTCNNIGDVRFRDACKEAVAYETKNHGICDQVEDGNVKLTCIERVGILVGGMDACQRKESDEERNTCLSVIGTAGNNLDACQQITDTTVKENCLLSYALKNNKPLLCNQLTDIAFKVKCERLK